MSKIQVKQTVKHKNNNRKKSKKRSIKIIIKKKLEHLKQEYILLKYRLYEIAEGKKLSDIDDDSSLFFDTDDVEEEVDGKEIYISLEEMKEGLSKYLERLKKKQSKVLPTIKKEHLPLSSHDSVISHYTLYNIDKSEQKRKHEIEFQKLTNNVNWKVQEEDEWVVEKAEYEKWVRKGDRGFESFKRRLKENLNSNKEKESLNPNDFDRINSVNFVQKQLKELKFALDEGLITQDVYKSSANSIMEEVAEQLYGKKKLERERIAEIKKFIETGDESVLGNIYNFTDPAYKAIYIQQIKDRFAAAGRVKNTISPEMQQILLRREIQQKVRQQALKKAKSECEKLGIGRYGAHIKLGDTSRFARNSKAKIQAILSKASEKNAVTPSSYQRIVDIDHIFLKDDVKPSFTFTTPSGITKTIPEERITKEEQIDEIRQVNTLETAMIPKAFIKKGIIDEYYGAVVAATYFQMLVSNTPIDEKYSYFEKRIHYGTSKIKLPETMEDYDEADIDKQLENNKKVYLVKHTHVPDKEFIRDFWVLHYKGVEFYSKDYDKRLFEKKSDMKSAYIIAIDIYDRTKNLENKNIDFYAENTNWRYNMLEYGGYTRDGEANIGSKYGYEHGVKNKHSYQAPYGMKRLVDGLWNILVTSGRHYGYVSEFLNKNRNKLDVSKIESRIVKMITTDYPEIKQVGFTDDAEYVNIMKEA